MVRARKTSVFAKKRHRDHGTTAALLVREVAPQATIELYPVADLRGPNEKSIAAALTEALESSPDVVTISLGSASRRDSQDDFQPFTKDDCLICSSLTQHQANTVVFAAVGNDPRLVYCPSRYRDVVSIGFMSVSDEIAGDGSRLREAEDPSYPQSDGSIVTLVQVRDAIGSSFACPLLAAYALLTDHPRTILELRQSHLLYGNASAMQAKVQHDAPFTDPLVQNVLDLYEIALGAVPASHDHRSDPQPCVSCSLFTQRIYTNLALLVMRNDGRPEAIGRAESLLSYARQIAPRATATAANLGRLYLDQAYAAVTWGNLDAAGYFSRAAVEAYRDAADSNPEWSAWATIAAEAGNLSRYVNNAVIAIEMQQPETE